jgi:hypothetical protein
LLIERHSRDGSAVQAGCACIEEKHLLTLAGLASEMPTLAHAQDEAEFYMNLAAWAREMRETILDKNFGKANKQKHTVEKCVGKDCEKLQFDEKEFLELEQ